jgi:membrane protein
MTVRRRMSTGDADRPVSAQFTREPLWVIGLSAVLVAAGFGRRLSDDGYSRQSGRARLDDRRGRFAEGPSKIPARWKNIFLRVYNGIAEERIFANAAGVTFYSLLALFPGIAALVSIYGLFADPSTIVSHLDTISGFAPGGAIDVLRQQLTRNGRARQHHARC